MLLRPPPLFSIVVALSSLCILGIYSATTFSVQVAPFFGNDVLSFRSTVDSWTKLDPSNGRFDKILVINLAKREDRRNHMETLAKLHNLDLEYFNATSYTSSEVVWVQERILEDTKGIQWAGLHSLNEDAPESWEKYYASVPVPRPSFPSIYPASDLIGLTFPLVSAGVTSLPGPVACYVSHLNVLHHIIRMNASRTLVLEDDIDLAWDFQSSWTSLIHSLEFSPSSTPESKEWEMIYLGYSFTDEQRNPPIYHPYLRMADRPLGTFGYTVSQKGARVLLEYLSEPARLFKEPVDWAYVDYLKSDLGKGKVFSSLPPLIGHGRWEFGTDIGGGSNNFKTWLADSSMARLEEYNRLLLPESDLRAR